MEVPLSEGDIKEGIQSSAGDTERLNMALRRFALQAFIVGLAPFRLVPCCIWQPVA